MNRIAKGKRIALTAMTFLTFSSLIAGCGSNAAGGAALNSGASTVSGVAAAGSPLVGTAYLKDSSVPAKELSVPLNNDGSFTFDVTGMQKPFIMQATGTAGSVTHTMYSISAGPGTANINPMSNVALANAADGTDPALDFASPSQTRLQTMSANMPMAVAALEAKLKPLLDQYGVNSDPVTGTFVADHTGLDAVFDAVTMNVSAGAITVVNNSTNAVVFSCQTQNISGGNFTMANMPSMQTSTTPATTNTTPVTTTTTPTTTTTTTTTPTTTTPTTTTTTTTPTTTTTTPATQTWAQYKQYCSGCHGTSKQGKTAAQISAAITANIGGMGSLSSLSSATITAIAAGQ